MAAELHRIEPGTGGIIRKVVGRGFSYVSSRGQKITSDALLYRIGALAIPPAWTRVWIASDSHAHIQATGVDAAGRTQYIYHPRWREIRDDEKFVRSLAFAQCLTLVRRTVTRDLKQVQDTRRRTLAAAVRLIDRAGLRVGGANYAEDNGSYGATTLQRRHVRVDGEDIHLVFQGKSGGSWDVSFADGLLGAYFASVPHAPTKGPALCHAVMSGRRKVWHSVSDAEVNSYLADVAGNGFTAKDFRTWQGTVVAAISLARSHRNGTSSTTAVTTAIQEAASWLHNTTAIAKDSYINPHVITLFEQGKVAQLNRQHDSAVRRLLEADDMNR